MAAAGEYAVTKSPPELVPPSSPTPSGPIPLSSIDKTAAVRVSVDFIQVFPAKGSDRPTEAVRSGLAEALVYYYPVAGRISEPVAGEPEVDCSGEGVWFVAATAGCSLAEVNGLERPLLIPKEQLLPRPPEGVKADDCILMAQVSGDGMGQRVVHPLNSTLTASEAPGIFRDFSQDEVTEFACGGYAVGICFSHLVFDGVGAAQFLKAVGEMARGLPTPSVDPVWHRDMIPNPPKLPLGGLPPSFTAFDFDKSVVDIPLSTINRIKDGVGHKCSTFDVVTAILWKCRVAAIAAAPGTAVCLGFAASTRHLLSGVLPAVDGYYGNCVYPGGITRGSTQVNAASVVDIVGLIRDAKEALSARFVNWMKGGGSSDSHYNVPLDYNTLVVTDWSHVGFNEVDYGSGMPDYVFTLNDDVNIVPSAVYLRPPARKQGIRLLLQCVEAPHAAALRSELLKLQT